MDIYSLPSGAEIVIDFNPYYDLSPTIGDELLVKDAFKSIGAVFARAESWGSDAFVEQANISGQLCFCSQLYCDMDTAG